MAPSSKEIAALLSRLCLELGFCLAPEDIARLKANPPESVQGFVDEVFKAEGLEPILSSNELLNEVRSRVEQVFRG